MKKLRLKPAPLFFFAVSVIAAPCPLLQFDFLLPAAHAASKLGDLSKFRIIASDSLSLIERGEWDRIKDRIKQLELSWDEAEAGIKPRDARSWHKIDQALDRALTSIRADHPVREECKKAVADLISIIEAAS